MRLVYFRYRLKTPIPEKMLSSLIRSGLPFSSPVKEEDGLSFSTGIFVRRSVRNWAKREKLDVSCELCGLFQPILALKHRPGIIFGTILSYVCQNAVIRKNAIPTNKTRL